MPRSGNAGLPIAGSVQVEHCCKTCRSEDGAADTVAHREGRWRMMWSLTPKKEQDTMQETIDFHNRVRGGCSSPHAVVSRLGRWRFIVHGTLHLWQNLR